DSIACGDAVVIGTAHPGNRGSTVACAVDGVIDRHAAGVMSKAVLGVEKRNRRLAALQYRPRGRIHHASIGELYVLGKTRRSVRGNPAEVGGNQKLGDVPGDIRRGSETLHHLGSPAEESAGIDAQSSFWIV